MNTDLKTKVEKLNQEFQDALQGNLNVNPEKQRMYIDLFKKTGEVGDEVFDKENKSYKIVPHDESGSILFIQDTEGKAAEFVSGEDFYGNFRKNINDTQTINSINDIDISKSGGVVDEIRTTPAPSYNYVSFFAGKSLKNKEDYLLISNHLDKQNMSIYERKTMKEFKIYPINQESNKFVIRDEKTGEISTIGIEDLRREYCLELGEPFYDFWTHFKPMGVYKPTLGDLFENEDLSNNQEVVIDKESQEKHKSLLKKMQYSVFNNDTKKFFKRNDKRQMEKFAKINNLADHLTVKVNSSENLDKNDIEKQCKSLSRQVNKLCRHGSGLPLKVQENMPDLQNKLKEIADNEYIKKMELDKYFKDMIERISAMFNRFANAVKSKIGLSHG